MLENKWKSGKANWGKIDLPEFMEVHSGIVPYNSVLDPEIGTETVLFIIDRTDFANKLASLSPFSMHLNIALLPFDAGPVCSCFFWLENPNGEDPFASFENTLNPHDPELLRPYWDLARQTHWHIFVIGPDNEVLNWFEFPNVFKVGESLKQIEEIIVDHPCTDFMAAKREHEQRYSMDDLFQLGKEFG